MAWVDPITWSTNDAINATRLNTIRDALKAIGDPWTPYTPSWTGSTSDPAINNGSLGGLVRQVGKTVDWRIFLTIGSSTTLGSGTYAWSLPVAAGTYPAVLGTGFVRNGSSFYGRTCIPVTASVVALVDDSAVRVSGSAPIALTSGMNISMGGSYEVS